MSVPQDPPTPTPTSSGAGVSPAQDVEALAASMAESVIARIINDDHDLYDGADSPIERSVASALRDLLPDTLATARREVVERVEAALDGMDPVVARLAEVSLRPVRAALDADTVGLAQAAGAVRQVWCVVYDSDTPLMDGTHPPIRMAEQDRDWAERNFALMQERSVRSPKRNLRIETRFVTEWTTVRGAR